ncbi:anti-sigma factor [Sphingomicrobium sediminis]|uniref:Anti-sigma factor n=1 Tax=Sphingomicrobium sediminis TaxID=2950949 RepID=A0A9X2EFW7_9SPHN|nr:anti-sigma factor [Sphingomicrobium sediminis]MCM8556656.1 anti-sigma factor [Sphingomicrobium sediminis]
MPSAPKLDPDRTVLAAEYAVGFLEGEDLVRAKRLSLIDEDFASLVEWWDLRFNEQHYRFMEVSPSSQMWTAIAARLSGQDNLAIGTAPVPKTRSFGQRFVAASILFAGALAILLLGMQLGDRELVVPEQVPADQPQNVQQLFAVLDGGDTGPALTTRIDPSSETLNVQISNVDPVALGDGRAPVLWVVPEGGAPTSLGMLEVDGIIIREISDAERALLQAGATLAVTYENIAEAPHQAPTTDILAAGELIRI